MMKVYLVTHGLRNSGPDPVHTPEGIAQIAALREKVASLPISTIIVGTGRRFQEIFETLMVGKETRWKYIPVFHSPLCGSADGLEKDGKVILTNGRKVSMDSYMGLNNCVAINIWRFLADLPDNALLCAGGELMITLGFEKFNQKGCLFEIDLEKKECRKIS
jgi:hypothetical protein